LLVGLSVLSGGVGRAEHRSAFIRGELAVERSELSASGCCVDTVRFDEAIPLKRYPFRPFLVGASVAIDPRAGEVFIADSDNGKIAVSDAAGKHVLRIIDVGDAPEHVVVDRSGRAFVT
jgi:YVTN family beta-propeller protein